MKKLILIIGLMFSVGTFSQEREFYRSPSIKGGTGIFIPQGKLTKYFGVSPYFEITVDIPFFNRDILGISVQCAVPRQKDNFTYIRTIDTIKTRSTFMLNLVANLKKRVIETSKKRLDLNFGIGVSGIQTDARNPDFSGEKSQNKYEMVSSLLINPSIEFTKKMKSSNELTFAFGLQYSPYKIEGAIQEDIGGLALIPKLIYLF
ncbi:hypothetical protein [Tenacibaculum xiamenense]|uniref:hypothetical protein n=1 Tax=Tenacibaculum xiamenense TaxID=1261553 RepID=UPI0038950963